VVSGRRLRRRRRFAPRGDLEPRWRRRRLHPRRRRLLHPYRLRLLHPRRRRIHC
jgi:hypothetical protein